MAEWAKQKWCTPLSKDEIAEFLTKTEQTECNNRKKEFCLPGVIYFLRCIRKKKKSFWFMFWYRAEKQEMFEECLRENKFD